MSSIFGQDVLDIVSDIVDPAASILHLTFYLALCIVQPDLIPCHNVGHHVQQLQLSFIV